MHHTASSLEGGRVMYMKKSMIIAAIVAVSMLFTAYCVGAAPKVSSDGLVTVEWLSKHMDDRGVVILDVRTFPKYMKNHIPGAIRAFGPWRLTNEKFVGFMAPPVGELEEMLREFGVSNDSLVIIYDQGMTSSDTAKSARALWTLHMLGHTNVAILDGGFNAWEQKELPLTATPAIPVRGNFTAKPVAKKAISLEEVQKKLGSKGTIFLDCRIPAEHFGHEKKSNIARFGHLPGSLLMPASFLTIGGQNFSPAYLRKKDELRQMASGVGLPNNSGAEIVVYSNTGEEAALCYFVLNNMLGYNNVRLFDGSVLEAAKAKDIAMVRYSWGWNDR